jgi:hypothetical protein
VVYFQNDKYQLNAYFFIIKMIELILSKDSFSDKIIEDLKTNSHIKELGIIFHGLDKNQINLLIKNLNKFKNIKKLLLSFEGNEEEMIINNLKYNDNIEILEIWKTNNLNIFKKISDLLKINTFIKSLAVMQYEIFEFNESKYFYNELARNTNLKILFIPLNNNLINSLKINKSITHLNYVFISQDICENFINLMRENKNIISIKTHFIGFNDDEYKKYADQTKYYLNRNKAEYAARIMKFNIYRLKFLEKIPRYIIEMIKAN